MLVDPYDLTWRRHLDGYLGLICIQHWLLKKKKKTRVIINLERKTVATALKRWSFSAVRRRKEQVVVGAARAQLLNRAVRVASG